MNSKWFSNRFLWLKSTKIIEDVYNSLLSNKDIDNTFPNDLAEIHKWKVENFKNVLVDNYLIILLIKVIRANLSRYDITKFVARYLKATL